METEQKELEQEEQVAEETQELDALEQAEQEQAAADLTDLFGDDTAGSAEPDDPGADGGEQGKPEGEQEATEKEEAAEDGGEEEEAAAKEAKPGVEAEPTREPAVDPEVLKLRDELQMLKAELEARQPKQEQKGFDATALEDKTFIKDDDELYKAFDSVESANKTLNAVRKQAIAESREVIYAELPRLVGSLVSAETGRRQAAQMFYEQNPDLKAHAEYVGAVAKRMYQDDPTISVEQLYSKLAPEVRKRLQLRDPMQEQAPPAKPAPRRTAAPTVPPKRGARAPLPTTKISEAERDVRDLFE